MICDPTTAQARQMRQTIDSNVYIKTFIQNMEEIPAFSA
jgi:hypothetical protein